VEFLLPSSGQTRTFDDQPKVSPQIRAASIPVEKFLPTVGFGDRVEQIAACRTEGVEAVSLAALSVFCRYDQPGARPVSGVESSDRSHPLCRLPEGQDNSPPPDTRGDRADPSGGLSGCVEQSLEFGD